MDEQWRDLAVSTRGALRLLGYNPPDCLPGEPDWCGGTCYQHAAAHLGALQAVTSHHLDHVGPSFRAISSDVQQKIRAELDRGCQDPVQGNAPMRLHP